MTVLHKNSIGLSWTYVHKACFLSVRYYLFHPSPLHHPPEQLLATFNCTTVIHILDCGYVLNAKPNLISMGCLNWLSNNWLCNSKRYCSYLIYYYQNSNHSEFLHKIKMSCLISKNNSKIDIVGQSTTQLPSHQNSLMASRAIPCFCLPPGTAQQQRNPEVKRFIRATVYSVNICRQS